MRTVFFTLLIACSLLAPTFALFASPAPNDDISLQEIHPQIVNRLLGYAAESLGISHGQSRQLYNQGRITITATQLDLNVSYDISLDGVCILIYIEDL